MLTLAVVVVAGVLTNQNLPVLTNGRVAFLLLFGIGIGMCTVGASGMFQGGGVGGVRLSGSIGGAIIVLLAFMVLFGWTAPFASLAAIAPNTRSLADAGDRGAFVLPVGTTGEVGRHR